MEEEKTCEKCGLLSYCNWETPPACPDWQPIFANDDMYHYMEGDNTVELFLNMADILREAMSSKGIHITHNDAIVVADEILRLRRQGEPARCNDCKMPYGQHDWIDTVLSNDQWELVAPDGGILCANCIIKRASKLPDIISSEMTLIFKEIV